ncbi:MAG: hypothetical protein ABI723_15595 [Bacteroidia bacterium]
MSTNKNNTNNNYFFEGGWEEHIQTNEYKLKVMKITAEVNAIYKPKIEAEGNFLRRYFLRRRRNKEINKRIKDLTEWNLYFA